VLFSLGDVSLPNYFDRGGLRQRWDCEKFPCLQKPPGEAALLVSGVKRGCREFSECVLVQSREKRLVTKVWGVSMQLLEGNRSRHESVVAARDILQEYYNIYIDLF
jgi:hypothetical protein